MEETNTQWGIRHGKSGTIASFALYFVAQFFGVENPMEQLDRLEFNQAVMMQRMGIQAKPLPPDTSIDEFMDAMETLRKANANPPNPSTSY